MSKLITKAYSFINEKILRNTKESSVLNMSLYYIILANIRHELKTKLNFPLKLAYPNKSLQFPLPNRWSSYNTSVSKQKSYMIKKQVSLNVKPAGIQMRNQINKYHDRSQSTIEVLNIFKTIRRGQMDQVNNVSNVYNVFSPPEYIPDRELLFADSLVNGQHSYMIRKYGQDYYQVQGSKQIDQNYRSAIEKAFKNQAWNEGNAKKFGLTREDIIKRLSENDGVYTMLFEHLESVSNGTTLTHRPQIYIEDENVDEIHYMNVPYPVLLKLKSEANEPPCFLCVAVGFRIDGQVHVFSPFFADQGEKLWRLVQSNVLQVVINDFNVRLHLGIYHFTTNQYHVPIYNVLHKLQGKQRQNMQNFIDHTYAMFSQGLDGVNLAASAFLLTNEPKYSFANRAFNINQDNIMTLIAGTSNHVKIFDFNPVSIMKNQGVSQDQKQFLDKFRFDAQLYEIISEYIEGVYKIQNVDEVVDKLFAEINHQTTLMGVGQGSAPRPKLRNNDDVLRTIKNLCFCWVGFHSHTYSMISFASYALLRPGMLRKNIPTNRNEWASLTIGDELPDTKILMEAGKLNEGATQRDPDNYLMDQISRQKESAGFLARMHSYNSQRKDNYLRLEQVASKTLERLQQYEKKVIENNQNRKKHPGSVRFEWMYPSSIQTSLR